MKINYFFTKKKNLILGGFLILISFTSYSQTLIFEDFEDSTVGYILKDESNGGTVFNEDITEATVEDYFGRIRLSNLANPNTLNFSAFNGSSFFGANDYDGAASYPTTRDIVSINWNNITVPTSTTIKISSLIAEGDSDDGLEDWDVYDGTRAASIVRIQYSFNNINWFDVFSIVGDNTVVGLAEQTNAAPVLDSNNDNIGDVPKVVINETFANFEGTFETGGNTNVHIRVYMENLTGGDEDIAFDDFKVEVAAPTDVTPPTVSSITVNGSPTANATSVSYNVTFSEDVTGVTTNDFTVDGSGVTGTISNISGSGSSYVVTVGSVSGTGTLSIDLKSSGTNIIDASSNAITTGFTAGENHTVDTDAPTATNITVNGSPTANATNVSYNVTFSENVTGVTTNDFTVDGSGVTGNITNVSGSGANYVITVSSVSGTGTLSIDLKSNGTTITDANNNAINGGFTAGSVHNVDTVAPNLTVSSPADNATGVLVNQNIELTFSENISKGTGNIIIKKTVDNSILETINISSAQVSIASNVATINPSNNFELNTAYHVEIDNTVFNDAANNSYAGISANSTLNFVSEANQTNTFNPFNGNWSDAPSWSLGRLPIATDNIVIGTGKTVNLNVASASVNNLNINVSGTLNILSGNALTINGNLTQNGTFNILSSATSNGSLIVSGTSTGNVTYFRYVTTNWHLISAPVVGQTINALVGQVNTNGNKYAIAPYKNNTTSLLRYNYYTDNTGTNDIATAGNFSKAKGYSMQKSAVAGTIAFTGSLNIDNAGESIPITDGGDNPAGNRWNLVGNPYTSAIKGNNAADANNNFLKVNIDANNLDPTRAGLYLWNGAAPYEIKSLDDVAFSIAPGQAFFVHAPDNGGTSVSFTEAMQIHQTGNNFLKTTNSYPEIILNLSENKNKAFTKIRYIENKTEGLDIGSDVGTFTGENSSFGLFSQLVDNSSTVNFAIQALPNNNFENTLIPIGVTSERGKEISFSINKNNFPSTLKIYLEDRELNKFVRLDEKNTFYSATLNDDKKTGRFYLHTKNSVLNTENITSEYIYIYKANKDLLRIQNLPEGKTEISIFNILGKQLLLTSTNNLKTKDVSIAQFSTGLYLIQVQTENGEINKKIIIE